MSNPHSTPWRPDTVVVPCFPFGEFMPNAVRDRTSPIGPNTTPCRDRYDVLRDEYYIMFRGRWCRASGVVWRAYGRSFAELVRSEERGETKIEFDECLTR